MGAHFQVVMPLEIVLGSMFGSVLLSILGVYLGAYSECTWEPLESVLGSV
jgi:hypothetical protein